MGPLKQAPVDHTLVLRPDRVRHGLDDVARLTPPVAPRGPDGVKQGLGDIDTVEVAADVLDVGARDRLLPWWTDRQWRTGQAVPLHPVEVAGARPRAGVCCRQG